MKKILIAILILFLAVPAFAQMRKAAGGTPTMGACGTSPSVSGKDSGGVITVGTSMGTACTLNFSQTYGAAPSCVGAGSARLVNDITTSTTAVTFNATVAYTDSQKIYYVCVQP